MSAAGESFPITIPDALAALVAGRTLSEQQASAVFERLLSGGMEPAQIGALLALLQIRPPTLDELVGAARVMRAHVTRITPPDGVPVLDTCGTGGAPKTFNISTAAALVAAAAARLDGTPRLAVAKHGNRSRTGRGSAELLAALGVNVDAAAAVEERCLAETGVCFCFAIHHHPAMKHAAGARRAVGFPTIFNLLGPLTNPAGAGLQLLGVYAPHLVRLVAEALQRLGTRAALVVHSEDGLDELTTTAETRIGRVGAGGVTEERFDARTVGLARANLEALRARDLEHAARIIRDVLEGQRGPARDIVVLNAAAALTLIGEEMGAAVRLAERAIDSGAAGRTLARLGEISRA